MSNKGYVKLLENIAVSSPIKVNENDYKGSDGLIYCGNCHTAKQARIEVNGVQLTPLCLCKCESEKYEREKAAKKADELRQQIERNRVACFSEPQMQSWNFEKDDRKNEKVSSISHKYVAHFPMMKEKGKGLIFCGGTGTGKSFMAACIANALLDEGYSVLMTNFPRLINTLTGMYTGKQEYIDSLNRYNLLIIDDLAVERSTEYTDEIVQNVVDSRYRSGLPMIITTNLTSKELTNANNISKARLYSRIMSMCLPITVAGEDRRKAQAAESFMELSELLGLKD